MDLTGIRQAGGSIYRMSLSGYRLRFDALAGNPRNDTYTQLRGRWGTDRSLRGAAERSGLGPSANNVHTSQPAVRRFHYAIRYDYYPRDMLDDPVQACDAGCTINFMRTGGPVWFQILCLDANHLPLATGDAQMLAAQ